MGVILGTDKKVKDDLTTNRTALETASLAAAGGSVANNVREGLLLRYIADNLSAGSTAEIETTTLDQGDGSRADHDRAGLLIRYTADYLNAAVVPDAAGTASGLHITTDGLIGDVNDEVETTTLAAGAGSAATTTRAGLLLRYICDSVGTALGAAVSTVIGLVAVNKAGRTQIKEVAITCAANAAATTIFTMDDSNILIKSITIRSNAATTADLTSFNIKGGASSVVVFIDDATGIKANVAAADQQVSWEGRVVLNDTDVIQIDPTGTGATALDFTAIVEYCACADGGHID